MTQFTIILILEIIVWLGMSAALSLLAFMTSGYHTTRRQHIIRTVLITAATAAWISFILYISIFDVRVDKSKLNEEWVANSCPVYQTECGVKQKYACERRAAVVGRNQVGDIFVIAYKTC